MAERIIGAVVIPRRKHGFVMVKHRNRFWEFPGGRVQKGETSKETAARELFEETGLKGQHWVDIGPLPGKRIDFFTCQAHGKTRIDPQEILEARVFNAPPLDLSFPKEEIFELLRRAGYRPKAKVNYDLAAEYFDDVRTSKPEHIDAWAENLIRSGSIGQGSKVLDIGCGTGRYALEIARRTGADVTGLDSSMGMLSKASEKEPGCWLRSDAVALPVQDGGFDTVIMMLVLQHVDDEALAISEAFRVLRPGGRLVVVTVSHARIRRHIMRYFPGLVSLDLRRFLSIPELRWHVQNAGFGGVRAHRLESEADTQTVNEIVKRFRRRYISTLVLLPERRFKSGLAVFEKKLRENYGKTVESKVELTFLEATKS